MIMAHFKMDFKITTRLRETEKEKKMNNKKNVVVVNMTPHDVTIVDGNGAQVRVFPRSGQTVRCQSTTEVIGDIDGIPMTRTVFGEPTIINADGTESALPEQKEGTVFIVSSMAAQAAKRDDFLVPNESVRNAEGIIIGCKSLGQV